MAPASSKPSLLSHPLTSYQPISLIYRVLKISSILARLPLWLVIAAVPALRPHKTWTFKQTFTRNLVRHFVEMDSIVGVSQTLSLAPGKEKDRWTTLEAFDDALYTGPLVSSSVKPATIGGTWHGVTTAPQTEADAAGWKSVALHIHGGAFVLGDGRDDYSGYQGSTLVKHGGFDAVFLPQYRLAGYAGRDPFPAALQDCLSSYLYLTRTLGVPARNVTVSGDSAGGNLAVALLRYLERFGGPTGVAKPGRLALLSPWVRPSAALRESYDSWALARTDIVPRSFIRWGAEAYLLQADGEAGEDNEWVDLLGHPFKTDTPVFVSWADKEILSVDCEAWAEEMRKEGGEGWKLVVNVEPNAPHDTLLLGEKMGWDASAEEVTRKIKKFVEETE